MGKVGERSRRNYFPVCKFKRNFLQSFPRLLSEVTCSCRMFSDLLNIEHTKNKIRLYSLTCRIVGSIFFAALHNCCRAT